VEILSILDYIPEKAGRGYFENPFKSDPSAKEAIAFWRSNRGGALTAEAAAELWEAELANPDRQADCGMVQVLFSLFRLVSTNIHKFRFLENLTNLTSFDEPEKCAEPEMFDS